ncbi:MAG: hypothetical protein ACKOPQ_03355 [Novosphingobium sp.]
MKTLFTSALAGKLADTASGLVGSNPFVKLGAAGIATRIAAASLPLALVVFGAATAWERHRKNAAKTPRKPRKTASTRSSKKAATPKTAAA